MPFLQSIMYEEGSKIFVFDNDKSDFKLLYDFNAVKGDSWDLVDAKLTIQIDSVSYLSFNGQNLKRLHVSYLQEPDPFISHDRCSTVIEKFGDFSFFMPYVYTGVDIPDFISMGLVKYENDTITVDSLQKYNLDCKVVITGLEKDALDYKISISPNPAQDKVSINGLYDSEIGIFDLKGTEYSLPLVSNEISISSLSSGLYLLKIDNQMYKFIKE